MKMITGLLVGATMLMSAFASAQYYSQASVSGQVLSYGPRGFMLQGPDGNYGIAVGSSTIVTDPWSSVILTGPGHVQVGDYVTATGFPTDQWVLQASQVIVRNPSPPVYTPYGNYYGNGVIVGGGTSTSFIQPGSNFNRFSTPINDLTNRFRN